MAIDRVITEVRQARETLAPRFNYDLRAIIEDAQKRQATGRRKIVRLPPRPVRKLTGTKLRNQPLGQETRHAACR